ncbi:MULTISPECIES: hypothetical protein [unclassified Roseivirga]|jgi:chromate transport protein ChrA|uniref:hypothetical protein n=1 Tax=unclassified Roseivirga TaxID=2626142 RepID=UPI0025810491|nr:MULTISPECIES: hypothetical protein [unclassified Roseivirga]MEC7753376.1 hypothetical protein [Bacteroidota bacterium]|tara:strand:- start:4066 stop:4482 length:417 start_codon:yes stop_codon:yes gene_type:complete
MRDSEQTTIEDFKAHSLPGLALLLTLLFFAYRGVTYAWLGSWLPLALVALVIFLLFFSLQKSAKGFGRALRFWAVLLIIWSSIRLLLSTVNQFLKPVPEAHIAEQLGFLGALTSLLFLFSGIILYRSSSRFLKKSQTS